MDTISIVIIIIGLCIIFTSIILFAISMTKKTLPSSLYDINYMCISLPFRQNKFKHLETFFKKKNQPLHLLSAINGKEIFQERFNNEVLSQGYQQHFINHPDQKGHLGAACSHIAAWQKVIDNNYGLTCILEDDVILDNNFLELMEDRIDRMMKVDPDFDILYLGGSCSYDTYQKCHFNDNKFPQEDYIYEVGYLIGLWGIVINGKKGAENILNQIFPLKWHIDHHLMNLITTKKIKAYMSIPNITYHPGNMSISSFNYKVSKPYNNYKSDTCP